MVTKAQKQTTKKWSQSEKGKQYRAKSHAKSKGQNWILLCPNPFAKSVSVAYHHILGAYVVAVPLDLHRLGTKKHHQENLRLILEQIYLGDIE